jgi:hypothetical protein
VRENEVSVAATQVVSVHVYEHLTSQALYQRRLSHVRQSTCFTRHAFRINKYVFWYGNLLESTHLEDAAVGGY